MSQWFLNGLHVSSANATNIAATVSITIAMAIVLLALSGCVSSPPQNLDDLCKIFDEKDDWHEDAKASADKWGTSVPVLMAIVHQESKFQADIKPEFEWYFVIPLGRASSAYGYSQALDQTWDGYVKDSGNWGADRDEFDDAIDFVGWYSATSYRRNKIKRDDAYHLYLAYHEGHGGFERRTFKSKAWLKKVAKKVSARAIRYRKQYQGCQKQLEDTGWFF